MQHYKDFRPTAFDHSGAFLRDQQDWLVVSLSQTRDSGILDRSNFRVALKMLGGESETVEVHRFGHWGPGWFEIIIVSPDDKERVAIAEDIESSLENYPILNESDWSELEWTELSEVWDKMRIRDRADYLQDNESPFALRADLGDLGDRAPSTYQRFYDAWSD